MALAAESQPVTDSAVCPLTNAPMATLQHKSLVLRISSWPMSATSPYNLIVLKADVVLGNARHFEGTPKAKEVKYRREPAQSAEKAGPRLP